jgi:phosphohistidine phosphatase
MQLYILRHAIAVPRGTPGYPNDDRPLTGEGIAKMTENAKGIYALTGGFNVIISSPLIRALHTAKITAEAAGYTKEIMITEYLLPGGAQRNLFNFLSGFEQNEKVMIVGHEPHLGFAASALLGINESVVELKKGALCRIDIGDFPTNGTGKLVYLLQPKELRLIKSELNNTGDAAE